MFLLFVQLRRRSAKQSAEPAVIPTRPGKLGRGNFPTLTLSRLTPDVSVSAAKSSSHSANPQAPSIRVPQEIDNADTSEGGEAQKIIGEERIEEEEEKENEEEEGGEIENEEEEQESNAEEGEEEGNTVGTSASDPVAGPSTADLEADLLVVKDLPSSSAFQDEGDLSPPLSELLALSPTSDDGGVAPVKTKDPIQLVQEVFGLCSGGLQALLQAPEELQRLEETIHFLTSTFYCSILSPRARRYVFSLSSQLPSLVSLQRAVLQDLEAIGAHFRTVEYRRVSAASQATPLGDCTEQLSELRRHSGVIEKECHAPDVNQNPS